MQYSFNIQNWYAIAPGLETLQAWQEWSHQSDYNWQNTLSKSTKIPMMTARRMSMPSRLAVEVGLSLLDAHPDYAIFISRHAEIERSHKILDCLNRNINISPTDFAMSVHNTAAGLLTISAENTLPLTSISASQDGFSQGMIEAQLMFHAGAKSVLLIDFDGLLPETYHAQISTHHVAYAVGFILTPGCDFTCRSIPKDASDYSNAQIENQIENIGENLSKNTPLPQAIEFLKSFLNKAPHFSLTGIRQNWSWNRNI